MSWVNKASSVIKEKAEDIVEGAQDLSEGAQDLSKEMKTSIEDLYSEIPSVKKRRAEELKEKEFQQMLKNKRKKEQWEDSGGWAGYLQRLWENEDVLGRKTGIKETFFNVPKKAISETVENIRQNVIKGQANEYEHLLNLHRQKEYEELNKGDSPFLKEPSKNYSLDYSEYYQYPDSEGKTGEERTPEFLMYHLEEEGPKPKISINNFKNLSYKERANILNTLKNDPYVKKIEYNKVTSELNDLNEELENMESEFRDSAKTEINQENLFVPKGVNVQPLSNEEASKVGAKHKLQFLNESKSLRDKIKKLELEQYDLVPDKNKATI